MTDAPKAPRTVEVAAALPEVTAAEVWTSSPSGFPLDGDSIALFSDRDGRAWRVVPHNGQWKKMEIT